MNDKERAVRVRRAEGETYVIARTAEGGFRVHSPKYPSFIHEVTGIPEEPACSCPDFVSHEADPDWRCKHILAVLGRVGEQDAGGTEEYDRQEREAIRTDGEPAKAATVRRRTGRTADGTAQMLIKRSISPDGRIDSLSVEFSAPVEKLPAGDIRERAERILELQEGIVERFMDRNGHDRTGKADTADDTAAGTPVPARMIEIAGMNGKYGRRLFITVEANGETLKLFGNRKELAEAITAAGFPERAERIAEGARLDLPCRVTTTPSADGRYTNIEQVFRAASHQPPAGGRR